MSRWKFMRQLEELLSDISPNEREEALQYYNDYFNDAGRENEQEVIKALGSPEQVAGIVRDGLSGNENLGEFTESGFKNSNIGQSNAIIKRTASGGSGSENGKDAGMRGTGAEKEGAQAGGSSDKDSSNEKPISGTGVTREKEGMPTWEIVLIVCACVFLSPVIFALAVTAIAAIMSVVIGLFCVCLGFAIAMAVLFIVAFALAGAGFGTIIPHPVAGIGLIGGTCICAALGILFLLVLVFLVGKCIPGIFQGIGYIFKKIFGKKGGEAV